MRKVLNGCAFSDAQGRFEWPDAPTSGSIRLDVDKPTFAEVLDRIFDAGNREITITLHRPLYLHGTVTDAVTGQPIERFNVIPGWGPIVPGGGVQWLTGLGDAHHGSGRFDLRGLFTDQGRRSIADRGRGLSTRRADRLQRRRRGNRPRLQAAQGPDDHGHRARPRWQARGVRGAEVTLRNPDKPGTTKTGPDGRYTFRGQDKPDAIVAVHESGFAVRPYDEIAASFDLALAPWGRIEGVLKVGKNLAPNQKVRAGQSSSLYGWVCMPPRPTSTAGLSSSGSHPGEITIYRLMDFPDHTGRVPSNPVFVEMEPGQTVRVEIGGNGRPVIGKLEVPQGFRLTDLVPGIASSRRSGPNHESPMTTRTSLANRKCVVRELLQDP